MADRLTVGVRIALGRERPLPDVHDHERDVHAAFDHLRQVDLGREPHRVVALRRKQARLDVVMRVELDHSIVNASRFRNHRALGVRLAGRIQNDGGQQTSHCRNQKDEFAHVRQQFPHYR